MSTSGTSEPSSVLMQVVAELTAAVAAHNRRLQRIERTAVHRSARPRWPAGPPRPSRTGARRAAHRPGVEADVASTATALAEWVTWLSQAYTLGQELPDNWRTDAAVVAELTALFQAWQEAYAPTGSGLDRVHWHDALDRALSRLRTWQHRRRDPADGLAAWVAWLREHYQLTSRIPQDWNTDAAITAELAALHAAWRTALPPDEASFDLVHWHDALDRVLARIADWQQARMVRQLSNQQLHSFQGSEVV